MQQGNPKLKITVFSDYICPFCYVGDARLNRLRAQFELRVNWCLVEIHPETSAEGEAFDTLGYTPQTWKRMMEKLGEMAAQDGLSFHAYRLTTNSRAALQLAEAAKYIDAGLFYRVHAAIFDAFFSRGINIGDKDCLRRLAADAGMRAEDIERSWGDPQVNQRLQNYRRAATQLQVAATPTFFIGEQRIDGAVPFTELLRAARAAA